VRQVERFYGSYEYSVDAKGRIILPSRLRGPFETKRALVSVYIDGCLAVWTSEEFNGLLSRAAAMEDQGTDGRYSARALTAMSSEVDIDGQWRLTIPPVLREWAGLQVDSPVMVIGALNRIELWQPDLWRQGMASSLASLANGTSPLFAQRALGIGSAPPAAGTVA
jgi:MraZ protein